ncbi:MAG: carboxypeptidase-like regulatory domain-containing protein, partial [Candidatus Neomarinimicrobiota bacterium]
MRRTAGVAFGLLFMPLCAFAQIGADTASITGKVTDAGTGVPLTGANVLVTGTGHDAATDAAGNYRIVNVPAGSYTISAQFIGYRTSAQDVTLQAGQALELSFALSASALALDEVVVTGTGQGATKRTLGTSISVIHAEETENLPIQSVGEMLAGRAAGVLAVSTTGTAGGPIRIRVRGMNSLSVSNEPIIYVDGIQIDNASRDPIFNYLGGQEQSRLGDISPDDIDHIEIVKGSAAATLYGTTAANGVIQIFTKRGRLNSQPRWTLETDQGFSSYKPDMFTYDEEEFSYVAPVALGLEDTIEVESFGGKLLRQRMIGDGVIETYHLSVRGGGETITYYLAGRSSREVGAFMPGTNKYQLYSVKANVSIQTSDKLSLTAVNYISFNRQFEVTNDNHIFGYMAQALLSKGDTSDALPHGEAIFALDRIDKIENRHETFRYTGSVHLNHQPQRNWNNRLLVGLDLTTDEFANIIPFQESVEAVPFGERTVDGRRFWSLTLDASSGLKTQLGNIGFATSVGALGFMEETKLLAARGEEFPFIGLSTIGAASIRDAWGTRFRSVNAGIYFQEVVDVNNVLFLTAAYRLDGNSAFGNEFRSQQYPKLAVSYLLDNLNIPLLGTINLKLRAANGQSGNQPAIFAKDRTFEPTSLAGEAG